jgi:lysophospholipase L1-like esterase
MKRDTWARVTTAFFATVIAIGLALLLGEIVLRLSGPGVMRLQHDRIILPQNRHYVLNNPTLRGVDPRVIHHKNSLGFRGAEPPADLAHWLSVVAVGGSTTEGFYLSDGQTWPEVVARELNKRFTRLWVNNAGLDGHSSYGHLILLHDYLLELHPKVILFLVGVNDVGRNDLVRSDREFIRANRDSHFWQKGLRHLEEKSRMAAWLENMARAAAAWKKGLLHPNVDPARCPVLDIPDAEIEAAVRQHRAAFIPAYEQRLRQLVELCKSAGILPVLITQPSLHGTGRDDATGVDLARIELAPGHNGRLDWQILEAYNSATRELAKKESIPLIDLAHRLPKTSRYFYDWYHFTRAGAQAVGQIVAESLEPVLTRHFPGFVSPH